MYQEISWGMFQGGFDVDSVASVGTPALSGFKSREVMRYLRYFELDPWASVVHGVIAAMELHFLIFFQYSVPLQLSRTVAASSCNMAPRKRNTRVAPLEGGQPALTTYLPPAYKTCNLTFSFFSRPLFFS